MVSENAVRLAVKEGARIFSEDRMREPRVGKAGQLVQVAHGKPGISHCFRGKYFLFSLGRLDPQNRFIRNSGARSNPISPIRDLFGVRASGVHDLLCFTLPCPQASRHVSPCLTRVKPAARVSTQASQGSALTGLYRWTPPGMDVSEN